MNSSECSDLDEDVILPNSPLNEYLQQFEDGENNAHPSKSICDNKPTLNRPATLFNEIKITFSEAISIFTVSVIKTILSCIHALFIPSLDVIELLNLTHVRKFIKECLILNDEDVAFLDSWISDHKSNKNISTELYKFFNLIALSFIIWAIFSWSNFTSFVTELLYFHSIYFAFEYFGNFFFLMTLCTMLLILLIMFAKATQLLCILTVIYRIRKVAKSVSGTVLLLKNNLRLIQEAELLARGFNSTSLSTIAERIELSTKLPIISTHRHHPALRKSIFIWVRDLFLNFRLATSEIICKLQLGEECYFSSHSLAMLDLKEFGDLVRLDVYSEQKELLKITDDFSLSSLRTMFNLLKLQISEYFKYILLVVSFDDPTRVLLHKYKIYGQVVVNMKKFCQTTDNIFVKASDAYKYYRSIEASACSGNVSKPPNSTQLTLEINLHNMSLYLKAALLRMLEAEDYLSKNKSSTMLHSRDVLKQVGKYINEVNCEVGAYYESSNCCSDILNKLLCKEKNEIPCPVVPERENDEEIAVPKNLIKCDFECKIEDEVFEDIATKTSIESNMTFEDDPEIEKLKKNSAVASNLMHELKNVLVPKADERRIREERALALKAISSEQCNRMHIASSENLTDNEKISTDVRFETERNMNDSPSFEKNEQDMEKEIAFDLPQSFLSNPNNFAASIAAMAMQRKINLGISNDTCFIGDSDESSESV